jgi:hypothetical protein
MGSRVGEADGWNAFQLRYISYKKKPTWNKWLHGPDCRGILSQSAIEHMQEDGRRAIERLNEAIHKLKRDPRFPRRPSAFGQHAMRTIVRHRLLPKRLLGTFWEAAVFDRDKYTCRHCGRSVSSVWRESNHARTIALVVDHLRCRAQGGLSYSFTNGLTACWSCNGIKSTLPVEAFLVELGSLTRAVQGTRSARNTSAPRPSRALLHGDGRAAERAANRRAPTPLAHAGRGRPATPAATPRR